MNHTLHLLNFFFILAAQGFWATTAKAKQVDLRSLDTQVKDQKNSGLCYSFALAAVLENRIAASTGYKINLSEAQITDEILTAKRRTNAAFHMEENVTGINDYQYYLFLRQLNPFGFETEWPFGGKQLVAKMSPVVTIEKGISRARFTEELQEDLSQVKKTLGDLEPVILNFPINASWPENNTGYIDPMQSLILKDGNYTTHSVAIVGYTDDNQYPGGGYLIAKNSWGVNWGQNGYAYIPYSYCSQFPGKPCWVHRIDPIRIDTNVIRQRSNVVPTSAPIANLPRRAIIGDTIVLGRKVPTGNIRNYRGALKIEGNAATTINTTILCKTTIEEILGVDNAVVETSGGGLTYLTFQADDEDIADIRAHTSQCWGPKGIEVVSDYKR